MRPLAFITASACSSLSTTGQPPLFQEIPVELSGVRFTHPLEKEHPMSYLYYSGAAAGGICIGDLNGDGINDLYLVGGSNKNKLFLGKGDFQYTLSDQEGIDGGNNWGTGASLVDIDNDGDLDIFQCNHVSPNELFINNGKGAFVKLQGAAGLDVKDACLNAYFADVDNDGDLDCFILCNIDHDPKGKPATPPYKISNGRPIVDPAYKTHYEIALKKDGRYHVDIYGRPDYLFLNDGTDENGFPVFRNIGEEAGIAMKGSGLSAIWWDCDMDGDLDLYVANDFEDSDRLFRNDGVNAAGIPTFVNAIADILPSTTWSSMGSDFADINNDGWPDLFVSEMSATTHFKAKTSMGGISDLDREIMTRGWPRQIRKNHLFIGTGTPFYSEQASAAKIPSTDWSWSAKFGDLDNDGLQDIFITNGVIRHFSNPDLTSYPAEYFIGKTQWEAYKNQPPMLEENIVYQNLDGKKFKKRTDWGLGLLGMSYPAAMGDLDNDGNLDLVVSDLGKNIKIYKNRGTTGNSLRIKLTGTKSNRMGIGARVVATDSKGVSHSRWMNPSTGFQAQNDSTLHIGLGKAKVTKVTVYWPSGIYQEISPEQDVKELTIIEKSTGKAPTRAKPSPKFIKAEAPAFTHKEKIFDDFGVQPLIPAKHSQLGPCLAKADVDGDGDEDFFVGGGNGQRGALFINDKGCFKKSPQTVFGGLAKYADDTAAVWFDADGDKDPDLLVITGGSEYPANDIVYRDHLYLNESENGHVKLVKAPEGAIPQLKDSGSCVAAADYDGDGDTDLFIGSRLVPGKYPMRPQNRLLRNDTTKDTVKFTEVTPEALKNCGMVTGASWTDLDNSGQPDLALSIDWGPITLFKNTNGHLSNVTSQAGTSKLRSWWRSIHALDVDQDGDLDLVAGNVGINTKYGKPLDKKPLMLYYGDMDGSGIPRIVEAKKGKNVHNRERPLPVRGRF